MPKKKTTSATKKTSPKAAKKAAKKIVKKTVKKAAKKTAPTAPKKVATTTVVPSVSPKSESPDSKSTPIVFSLDDVVQLMASKKQETNSQKKPVEQPAKKTVSPTPKKVIVDEEPVKQRVLGAASLADILGFNPSEKKKSTDLSSEEVPKKLQKYYNLLIQLRAHVRDEIDLHTSETLKHSSRDDSGDLSGYGTHQADAGTDTFDRDFALSLVSGEQEALNEIEEAILRIKKGTYGICEVTGRAIPAARLTAVPFARYSVEGQAEYEKNIRRKVDRTGNTGLFGDTSDTPKLATSDDDDE